MKTPHLTAEAGDFAPVAVMPGDPMRSRYIAENYLTDARLICDVRGVQAYTGYYFGTRVSVLASGMGMPSMGIYAYELFDVFGVDCIIRAGSAGAPSWSPTTMTSGCRSARRSSFSPWWAWPETVSASSWKW